MKSNYITEITDLIRDAVTSINAEITDVHAPGLPPENVDADYAYPCFPFAKALRMAPVKIATEIHARINQPEWLEKIEVVGPYINFTLSKTDLFQTVISNALSDDHRYGHAAVPSGDPVLVEYSSPNTNKPLHLGHIRNNVLGMAVINLLRAAGHKVIPASIMNDRGIHICKAMIAYRKFAEGQTPKSQEKKGDHFVGEMYVRFDKESKENPDLMEEAREELRKWEKGDPDTKSLWKEMNSWVYQGFSETYKRLGSVFELVQYESDTYLLGKEIVQTGLEKGVFKRRDDNSVWVDLTSAKLDEKALLRSDGTSLYVIQDMGVAVERFNTLDISEAIYVVGSEQIYHFKVLFEILKRLGYAWADRCKHLSYGMVYLPEGKMKSREGKVVDADDLMDQMKNMSLKIMEDSHFNIEIDKRDEIAESIGAGAIKYYILKFNPQKDIHFDPQKSLSFEGATGAYIQYCHARIASVVKKSGETISPDVDMSILGTVEETALARMLMQFPDVMKNSARELNPSRLAGYLWEVAKSFNVFYTRNRILDQEKPDLTRSRLALSVSAARVINTGLEILGIVPVNEM